MNNTPHFFTPLQLDHFQQAIADILLSFPGAMKEYDLIQQLQQPPYKLLSDIALRGDLQLFRTHFLVFHSLYRLQALWRHERAFELHIDPLHIELQKYQPSVAGLSRQDPLQAYYSDWDNMTGTTQADVDALLMSFWQGLGGLTPIASNDVESALQTLELSIVPTSLSVLRNHYRGLVHTHHPDKGGELERMQEIQAAYTVVQNYLKSSGM